MQTRDVFTGYERRRHKVRPSSSSTSVGIFLLVYIVLRATSFLFRSRKVDLAWRILTLRRLQRVRFVCSALATLAPKAHRPPTRSDPRAGCRLFLAGIMLARPQTFGPSVASATKPTRARAAPSSCAIWVTQVMYARHLRKDG